MTSNVPKLSIVYFGRFNKNNVNFGRFLDEQYYFLVANFDLMSITILFANDLTTIVWPFKTLPLKRISEIGFSILVWIFLRKNRTP